MERPSSVTCVLTQEVLGDGNSDLKGLEI